MTIIFTTVGNNTLKKWSSPHSQQKSSKYSTWVQPQKWQNDLCSFQGKTFNITVIWVSAPTSNDTEAEVEQSYDHSRPCITNTKKKKKKKDILFIIGPGM